MKKVTFIGIGDELLNGKIQDKNTYTLSRVCNNNGYKLIQSILIADNQASFDKVLNSALENSDIIITSGGLGPTKDDLTKVFLSRFFNQEIEYNQQALKISQENYRSKKKKYPIEDREYHLLPKSMEAIFNITGFAPGIKYQVDSKNIYSLPGVPSEFNPMVESILSQKFSDKKLLTYKTFGIPESKIFQKVDPQLWSNLESFGKVTSLPHLVGVDIGVELNSIQEESKVDQIINESAISSFIIAKSSKNIYQLVFEKLVKESMSITFAESCTGGLLSSHITNFSGSSQIFNGSIISYNNQVKGSELDVPQELIKRSSVYSTNVTQIMAKSAQSKFNSKLSIAVSGVAGPNDESDDNPVGTLAYSILYQDKMYSNKLHLGFTQRLRMKERFSQYIYSEIYKLINPFSL